MQKLTQILSTLIAAVLLLSLNAGCSAKAKKLQYMARADRHFDAGQYQKAEVEYISVLHFEPLNAHAFSRLGTIYYEQGRFSRAYAFLGKAAELQPNDMELHLKLGSICLAARKTKEARDEALLVLERMPANSEAPVLLADAATTRKQIDEAHARLEKLSTQVGDTAPLQLAFGALHLQEGKMSDAETAFKRAQALDPKSGGAHEALGVLRLAQNDPKGADLEFKSAAELSPARSGRRLSYANFKIKTGDLEAGKRLLEEITKAAPDYVPAWIGQAEIALTVKKYVDCDSLLKKALARDSGNHDILLLRGRLLLAQGEAARAIGELERTVALYPRSPKLHYYVAVAQIANNDPNKALKSLNQALILEPNFDEAILLRAQINVGRDEIASVIVALTELIKRRPQLVEAHLLLADAYRAEGNLADSLAVLGKLEGMLPKNPKIPVMMGIVYGQQRKKDEARKAFGKALELQPGYLTALEYLVDLDLGDKQFTAAAGRLQPEIEKNPKAPALLLLLARVYAEEPRVDQAEAALLKAIEVNPNFEEAYLRLARLYVANKNTSSALEKLNQALRAHPKDVTALMLKGILQAETKDFAAAKATYEALLEINPKFYPALNNLAYLYTEQFGQLDKAFEMARRADELARTIKEYLPLKPKSSDTLGWVLFKRAEYSWALSLLQESAEKLQGEPDVQFHLGMTYYMMGQEQRARNALTRALGLNKDFPARDEAARRLATLAIDANTTGPDVLANLEKRLLDEPGDPVILARVAAIYEREGNSEKAVKAYESALKRNPRSVPVLVKLARLYSLRPHQVGEALELANRAYKLAPEDSEIARILGRLVFQTGDHKWALTLLQQGAALGPQDPETLYDLASAYYSVGRISEAELTMQRALQTGSAFARQKDAKQFLDILPLAASPSKALSAEPQAQQRLQANPDDVPALMVAALAAEQRNDAIMARQHYERALKLYPDFAPAMKHLAVLYANLGDDQKAYAMAAKARVALPDDPEVARTLGILLYLRKDYPNSARLLDESVRKEKGNGSSMYFCRAALQRALAANVQPKLADDAKRVLAQLK